MDEGSIPSRSTRGVVQKLTEKHRSHGLCGKTAAHFRWAESVSTFGTVAEGSCRPDNVVKLDQTLKAKRKLAQVVMFASRSTVAPARQLAMAA